MTVELTVLKDGGILLVNDEGYPDDIKRVEYYREQKLFMLVYNDQEIEDELMHYEIPEHMAHPVEKSPNIIICSYDQNNAPMAYKAPLIKVGELY
ncbi:MAG: hypothetical protein AAF204_00375 [Pseudomonadota bacterium]